MSNGEVCCILGVCCPPGGAAQFEQLSLKIQKNRPQFTPAQGDKMSASGRWRARLVPLYAWGDQVTHRQTRGRS